MTDVAFLKDEVGMALSLGIAEVVTANPRDPVGYLGHWLLHYLDQKSRAESKIIQERHAELEREQRGKQRLEEERISAALLQREWRAHQVNVRERARKEAELIERLQELSATAEERYNVEDAVANAEGSTETDPAEREILALHLHADVLFQRSVLFLDGLTKSHVAALKYTTNPSILLHRTIRCALYLVEEKTPAQVGHGEDWNACRACIKPSAFLARLRVYHPFQVTEGGAPRTPRRVVERVRRLLKGYSEDAARSDPVGGACLFLLFQYVQAAVGARRAYDDVVQERKRLEKDTMPPHRLFPPEGPAPAMESWECAELVEPGEANDCEEERIRLEEAEEEEEARRAALEEETRRHNDMDGDDALGEEEEEA